MDRKQKQRVLFEWHMQGKAVSNFNPGGSISL